MMTVKSEKFSNATSKNVQKCFKKHSRYIKAELKIRINFRIGLES